jgi:hypothetical protein
MCGLFDRRRQCVEYTGDGLSARQPSLASARNQSLRACIIAVRCSRCLVRLEARANGSRAT